MFPVSYIFPAESIADISCCNTIIASLLFYYLTEGELQGIYKAKCPPLHPLLHRRSILPPNNHDKHGGIVHYGGLGEVGDVFNSIMYWN